MKRGTSTIFSQRLCYSSAIPLALLCFAVSISVTELAYAQRGGGMCAGGMGGGAGGGAGGGRAGAMMGNPQQAMAMMQDMMSRQQQMRSRSKQRQPHQRQQGMQQFQLTNAMQPVLASQRSRNRGTASVNTDRPMTRKERLVAQLRERDARRRQARLDRQASR